MAAKPKGVAKRGTYLHLASLVGDIVQVTFWVRVLVVDGWRGDAGLQRLGGQDHFHGTGRAKHVADGTLGRADGNVGGMLPEDPLDCQRFTDVALRRAGTVGIDIIDIIRIKPGVAQGHAHAAGGSFPFR